MREKHYKKKIIFAFFFKSFLQEIRALISENKSQSQGILIEKLSCLIREWWYFFNFCPFSNCFVPDTFLPLSFPSPSSSSAPFLKRDSYFSGFSFSYFFRHKVRLKQFCCFFKTTFLRLFFSFFLDPQNGEEPKSLDSLYFLRYSRSGGSKAQKEELSIGLKKGLLCKKKYSTVLKKNIAFKKRGAPSSKTNFFLKSLFFRRLFFKRVRSSFNEEAIIKVHNELKRKRVVLPPRIERERSYRSELTPPPPSCCTEYPKGEAREKGKFYHARLCATKKSYNITLSKGLNYQRGVAFIAFPFRVGRNPYFFRKFKPSQTLYVRFSFLLFFSFLPINPFLVALPNCFLANLRKNEILTISKKRYLTFFELEKNIPSLMSLVGSSSSFDLSLARVKKDRNDVFSYPIIRNSLVPSKEEKKAVTGGSLSSFFTREEARGNPNIKKPTNTFLGFLDEKVLRISKSSDSLILKLLWKWTYKKHSKKSNKWLIKQYFPKINGQNRIFANKEHVKLTNNKKKFVTELASIRSFPQLDGNKREKGKYFFPKGYSFPFGYSVQQEKSASNLGTLLKNLNILPFRSKNVVKAKSFLQTSCFSGGATECSKLLNPSPLSCYPPLAFPSSPSPFLLLTFASSPSHFGGRQPVGERKGGEQQKKGEKGEATERGRGKKSFSSYKRVLTLDLFERNQGYNFKRCLLKNILGRTKRSRIFFPSKNPLIFRLRTTDKNYTSLSFLNNKARKGVKETKKNPYSVLTFDSSSCRTPYLPPFDSSSFRTPYLLPKKVIKKEKDEPQIVLTTVTKETEKPSFQYFINPKPLLFINTPIKLRKTNMSKIRNERSSLQFNLLFSVPTFREIRLTQDKKKIKKNSPRKICDQINDLLYWSYRKSHYFLNS